MLNYCNPIKTADNLTFSIDNVVLDLHISNPVSRDLLMALLDQMPFKSSVDVTHWSSFRPGTFREQFKIQMQDHTSFWLGVVLNGRKPEWGRVRLDFNPNKVAIHCAFQELLSFLIQNTRSMHRVVKRFDLACDIPVLRCNAFLVKDNRAYIERRHGQEWTQYLGAKSSTVGRVKLYNKTVESGLNYPLTRLELTIDPEIPFDKIPWPTVYYLKDLQMCFDEFKANETERFILNAILQSCGTLDQLGRRMREKIELMMEQYVSRVEISMRVYNEILSQLYLYTKGIVKSDIAELDRPLPPLKPLPDWVLEADKQI